MRKFIKSNSFISQKNQQPSLDNIKQEESLKDSHYQNSKNIYDSKYLKLLKKHNDLLKKSNHI